ncbi:Lsr2 family protein [Gordonia jinhuaensis]|uniref:Lsr2 family protein n=1 Tax=Gordonia jinhuaensis TaxID=1517702 RepID=A0A916THH7_9ACTN|nr:Lsr2 family protein [Gordonia jinhuaensis]GGB44051.1 Lsr2 family protein [Gordonia jinhuaensis]
MAKKQIVQFIDDLDGRVLDESETVRWSLDGKNYEFDTSPKHAQQFRDTLSKYIDASRSANSGRSRRGSGSAKTSSARSKERTHTIREWAIENGYEVSTRGRIPTSIIEAYDEEH